MSASMLPLVSNSRPMCSSGGVLIAAREVFDRLLLAVLEDLEGRRVRSVRKFAACR